MEKKYTVCIAGGGSRYTPGILDTLAAEMYRFPIGKIILYDIEEERQDRVEVYGKILMKDYCPECEVTATTDKKEAFTGVDFVFMQIRTGRIPMRQLDEKIALKHGCIGQETCGPGGFAYGMRSIGDFIELVKDIRTYAPEAWILNYTNPAALIAEATRVVYPNDRRIINICDMPIELLSLFGYFLGKDKKELTSEYYGLNHFGWFTSIRDKETGTELIPIIRDYLKSHEIDLAPLGLDADWTMTAEAELKMIRETDEYLPNNYLQYYLHPKDSFSHMNPDHTRADQILEVDEPRFLHMIDEVEKAGNIKGTEYERNVENTDGHADYIVDLAMAIAEDTGEDFILMTENKGVVPNLSQDMMIEVRCRVDRDGAHPYPMKEADTFRKGLLENQHAYEKLTVEACLEGSYTKALQALTLNRCVNDWDTAKALLDDYIVANKDYWPELK